MDDSTGVEGNSPLRCANLVWDFVYAPIVTGIQIATERLNKLQFLTIRKYLSLVFVALIMLLLRVSLWP